ncbi:MAG: hypothetical protein JXQ89_21725 [Pelagimonas sp.]
MAEDRTFTAASRQLRGMGLPHYEITMKGPKGTSVDVMPSNEILNDLGRLKRGNRGGCHVYIRGPRDADHDLVLLDDISRFTPEKMKASGHDPAVVVQTSPGSIQAWVRLGRPVSAKVRHEVARELAALYGGDRAAVNPHQAGRLAGFTNQKPEHKGPKGFPYVLLLNAPGQPAPDAERLIDDAAIKAAQAEERLKAMMVDELQISASGDAHRDLVAAWTTEYAKQIQPDLSKVDWWIVNLGLGRDVHPDVLASALAAVADRKGKHAIDYAERTVRKALSERR